MLLKKQFELVIGELISVLQLLSDEDYKSPSVLLNNHSIGGHTRHIIELFLCLLNGYEEGTICYSNRNRDKKIELDRLFAVALLSKIEKEISRPNKALVMQEMVISTDPNFITIDTNFDREVLYNIEHSIHHMAIIRIAIKEKSNIDLPENFGVAASTIQFKKIGIQ